MTRQLIDDFIWDLSDHNMKRGEFQFLDDLIGMQYLDWSVETQVTFLAATLPAKGKIPNRAKLFWAARRSLEELGEDADEVLVGLQ